MEDAGAAANAGKEKERKEEAGPDWLPPESIGGDERGSGFLAAAGGVPSPRGKVVSARSRQPRIVVHLDLDCFYAQVEMIYNPELRNKPVGVHQKSVLVTCNYEARKFGISKLLWVKDAKELCPELVLVNGEDLTKYREISYKVTALLEEFSPLVERLGFDENFVDITELVEEKLKQKEKDTFSTICVSGHVYNNQPIDLHDPVHIRLAAGSQIAAEMREALRSRLELTGKAGVAQNKLLSKLVSGTFKPNQQTVLLPESQQALMVRLKDIKKVPGIGFKTAKRLAMLGLTTVRDIQMYPAAMLEKELGASVAQHIQNLSWGEDDSPVTPSRAPQSLSDEDSFKNCSSEEEVRTKIEDLLNSLLDRLNKDGRKPHTMRLTIRQFSRTNRESRQCPIPSRIAQKIGTGDASTKIHLVDLLMKLFHKLINVHLPFHLTLLSVCFSNLKEPPVSTKQSIRFYLTQSPSRSAKLIQKTEDRSTENTMPDDQPDYDEAVSGAGDTESIKAPQENEGVLKNPGVLDFPFQSLPAEIDRDVFNQLPTDIKEEILSSPVKGKYAQLVTREMTSEEVPETIDGLLPSGSDYLHIGLPASCTNSSTNDTSPLTTYGCSPKCLASPHNPVETTRKTLTTGPTGTMHVTNPSSVPPFPSPQTCIPEDRHLSEKASSVLGLPPNIDPKTFSELPAEMQEELLAEWKGQDPVSKVRPSKTPEKLKRKKKGLPLPPQSNSLLSYFKPS